jgi:hypothetical protein
MRLFLAILAGLLALVLVAEAAVVLHGSWRVGRMEEERDELRSEVSRLEFHLHLRDTVERRAWVVERKRSLANCLAKQEALSPEQEAALAELEERVVAALVENLREIHEEESR